MLVAVLGKGEEYNHAVREKAEPLDNNTFYYVDYTVLENVHIGNNTLPNINYCVSKAKPVHVVTPFIILTAVF